MKLQRLALGWLLSSVLFCTWSAAAQSREATLSAQASLPVLEQLALERSPLLALSNARSQTQRVIAEGQGRVASPELVYQQWAVPLARPHDLSRANMVMLGARVKIPHAGERGPMRRAGHARAAAQEQDAESARRAIRYELRRAYLSYERAHEERALHASHQTLMEQLFETLSASYRSAGARQVELLDARAALNELHRNALSAEARLASSRERINVLTGRPVDAPLGAPQAMSMRTPTREELERALASRPELRQLQHERRAMQHELIASHTQRRRPEWMVGLDWMAMPEHADYARYGAMVSMTMPWFSSALRTEAKRQEQALVESQHSLALEEQRGALELSDSWHALTAAEETQTLLETQMVPLLEQGYQAVLGELSQGQVAAREVLERADRLLSAKLALTQAREERAALLLTLERLTGLALTLHGGAP